MTITMDNHKKFKKLADVFASDVVRDGTTKIKDPFQSQTEREELFESCTSNSD
jgi:hypothetical protein